MSIIKSFSVGEGDMFYIFHNSDYFSVIDCCMDENSQEEITRELKTKRNIKGIWRFISTHPDDDHIRGLKYLCSQITMNNFYCVKNKAIKPDETEDFEYYCDLRDRETVAYHVFRGCSRKWLNESGDGRTSSGIHFLWPDTSNEDYKDALSKAAEGKVFNNISPIFTYSASGGVTAMWMGDMEHDFLEKIKDDVSWPEIDILFAPHHGRESGKVSEDVLKKLDPKIIVIGEAPSQYLNYYSGYDTIKQNSAGDIVFHCTGSKVHVYVSEKNYRYDTSFLSDEGEENDDYGHYIGSFTPKAAQ